LWAFNEEPVARAMARSRIPIISAVGHEDDWTIADYVADRRASTPTDAAKPLVQEQQALAEQARELLQGLVDTMQGYMESEQSAVEQLAERLRLLHPMHQLKEYANRVSEFQTRFVNSIRYRLDHEQKHLAGLAGRLQALSPIAVLARGYSITFKLPQRSVVTTANSLRIGDALETFLAQGKVVSAVAEVFEDSGESDGAAS